MHGAENVSAKACVISSLGSHLWMWDGHEIIIDMRPLEIDFQRTVKDTQMGVIRKRLADNRLSHVSSLPLAAKIFVFDHLPTFESDQATAQIRELDIAYSRVMKIAEDGFFRHQNRKRWQSGIIVILPIFSKALHVERAYFGPKGMAIEYWQQVDAEANERGILLPPGMIIT
ncbi:MAG: hypothetical protein ACK4Y9_11075 [Hyphomonas sp.]